MGDSHHKSSPQNPNRKKNETLSLKAQLTQLFIENKSEKSKRPVRKDKKVKGPYEKFKPRVQNLLVSIRRNEYAVFILNQDSYKNVGLRNKGQIEESKKLERKVMQDKKEVKNTIKELTEMNPGPRWDTISIDSNGEIDLDRVLCTSCGSNESSSNNDIVLCDNQNCFKAFHQKCVIPNIPNSVIADESSDWVCRQCQTLIECLEMLEREYPGATFDKWQDIYPECEEEKAEEDEFEEESDSSGDLNFLPKKLKDKNSDEDSSEDHAADDEGDGKLFGFDEQSIDDEYGSGDTDTSFESIGNGVDEIAKLSDISYDSSNSTDFETENKYRTKSIGERILIRRKHSRPKEAEVALKGKEDVGRPMAHVKKGYLTFGEVVEYVPPEDQNGSAKWICEVGESKIELDEKGFLKALNFYETEMERQKRTARSTTNEKTNEVIQKHGHLSPTNIVRHTRVKERVDYIALNKELASESFFENLNAQNNVADAEKLLAPKNLNVSPKAMPAKKRRKCDEIKRGNGGTHLAETEMKEFVFERMEKLSENVVSVENSVQEICGRKMEG